VAYFRNEAKVSFWRAALARRPPRHDAGSAPIILTYRKNLL
jgi:hypothetical protein